MSDQDAFINCFDAFKSFFEIHVLPHWKKGFEYFNNNESFNIISLNNEKHTYIRDPIWGEIRLNKLEVEILDSFFIQRLRYIAQMGGTKFVYPAANHKRFDHSLGTFAGISLILDEKILKRRQENYIANITIIYQQYKLLNPELANKYLSDQYESFRIFILLNLKISMLMHDIGHYPFSHAFEVFLKRNQNIVNHYRTNEEKFINKPHEYRSKQIIIGEDPVLNSFIDSDLTKSISTFFQKLDLDLNLISKSITGESAFVLSQIINGVLDADKMDYLTRDNYFAIASFPLNVFDRIYRRAKFKQINEQQEFRMIFDDKAVSAILKVIINRAFEFNDIINHPVQLCFQGMFNACLERVFQQFDMEIQIEILKRIELMNDEELLHSIAILANGNQLINDLLYRITYRKLYKQVGYYNKSKFPQFIKMMKNAQKDSLFIDADALNMCLSNEHECEKDFNPLINGMKENNSGLLIFYNEPVKSIGDDFEKIQIELKDNRIITLKELVDERYREHFNSFLNYSSKKEKKSVADLFDFLNILDDKIYIYISKPLLDVAKKIFKKIEKDDKILINFFNKISICISP